MNLKLFNANSLRAYYLNFTSNLQRTFEYSRFEVTGAKVPIRFVIIQYSKILNHLTPLNYAQYVRIINQLLNHHNFLSSLSIVLIIF